MNQYNKDMTESIFFAGDLGRFMAEHGFEPFRQKQIYEWLYRKRCNSFDEMKNLPKTLRQKLKEKYHIFSSKLIETIGEKKAETVKILVQFKDALCVENAIISSPDRLTFCLSSQIGCPIACIFCASGKAGFIRNLGSAEIIEEFLHCAGVSSSLPDNIVIMGVGEPLLNYDNLVMALRKLCSPEGFCISPRRITISTSGYVPAITKLAKEGEPWNLALSLHSAFDEIRKKLVPGIKYSIEEIMNACAAYQKISGRIVTIEYVMLDGINCSEDDASRLAKLCSEYNMKINLIPFNPHKEADFKRPSEETIRIFEKNLRRYKVPFTRRIEKGAEINAACGQLTIGKIEKVKNAGK